MNFIAMNRFQIRLGQEHEFEDMWRNRESRLKEVPGFKEFRLLKGPKSGDAQLYSSHVIWESKADFENWTQSQHFRDAHKNVGKASGRSAIMGAPKFEGFETVLHED
jgi:heme-degrading monooxygenase HmoA